MTVAENWFQRLTVHWCPPRRLDLVEHVKAGRLQVVQAGNFGPMFYGLADDESVSRWFPGQPGVGLAVCLEEARTLIAAVQDAGARYVGQMSLSWHYGDHEAGKGLWEVWPRLWTPDLLGDAPCDDVVRACQIDDSGQVRAWPISGRPYRTYAGCLHNPAWRAVLKPMIRKAIDLGVDGFNVHHNFETLCRCRYCRAALWPRLQEAFCAAERARLFGSDHLEEAGDLLSARKGPEGDLRHRLGHVLETAANYMRKEAIDELFVEYGRSLKPDLMVAQWYHKYDFKPRDERSRLPGGVWARDESYLWYSQGSQKGVTHRRHGYLADMGMPARFLHAAAAGRPFVVNKYDWTRWRLSIAEMAAHGGAALAVHWAQHYEDESDRDVAAYTGPVYRYHRFAAEHESLIRGARPHGELALVYPRRGELAGDPACTDALRHIGRWLEDDHWLFDIILDEQLVERTRDYDALILADVARLSPEEVAHIRWWLEEADGRLVLVGANGTLREDGRPRAEPPFAAWEGEEAARPCDDAGRRDDEAGPGSEGGPGGTGRRVGGVCRFDGGRVLRLIHHDWPATSVQTDGGGQIRVYPRTGEDPFARQVLLAFEELLAGRRLRTTAPWTVRVRAWRPAQDEDRLVLHWLNYHQREDVGQEEVPVPSGCFGVQLALPPGRRAAGVAWHDPEADGATELDFRQAGSVVAFEAPSLTVWSICVVHLHSA